MIASVIHRADLKVGVTTWAGGIVSLPLQWFAITEDEAKSMRLGDRVKTGGRKKVSAPKGWT